MRALNLVDVTDESKRRPNFQRAWVEEEENLVDEDELPGERDGDDYISDGGYDF